jgi:MFS family permease
MDRSSGARGNAAGLLRRLTEVPRRILTSRLGWPPHLGDARESTSDAPHAIHVALVSFLKGHLAMRSPFLETKSLHGISALGSWAEQTVKARIQRKWNLFIGCLVGAIGLIIAGLIGGSFWSLAAMCLATIGFYGSKGPFWPLPSTFLTGTAAAAGMALINSVGNVGGFMGPFLVGWIKDSTGNFENGLYALAGFMLLAAVVTAIGVYAPRGRVMPGGLKPSAAE